MKPANKFHATRRVCFASIFALTLSSLSAQTAVDATDGIEFGTDADNPAMGKNANSDDLDVGVASGKTLNVYSGGDTYPYFKTGQGNSAKVTAGKWYRIAMAQQVGGIRANALFSLRDNISGGGHSTAVFRAGMSYGDQSRMGVALLSHTSYMTTTFPEIRILEATTYDDVYLEVKVNRAGDVRYSIQDNLATGGWIPVDWTETTSIPGGYTERKFNIDKLFMVGDYQSRFSIARGGAIGFGAESNGLFPLEIAADGSLKSQGNTIFDTNGILNPDSLQLDSLQLGAAPAIDATAANELFDFSQIVTPVDPTVQDSVINVSSGYSNMADVAIDSSGNRYVTGYFYGSMTIGGTTMTGNSNGNGQAFVAKLDSDGSVIWAKVLNGGDDSSSGYGNSVSVSSSGEVVIAGYFYGSSFTIDSTHVLTSAGSGDAFVVKLASNGSIIWAQSLGSTSYDYAQSVAIDGLGDVIVMGYFQGSNFATPGLPNLSSAGGYDVFVTKLSGANGTGVWSQRLGGTSYDYGRSLAVDTTGNVFVAGSFRSAQFTAGSFTLQNTNTSEDSFVVKLSGSTGEPEWAQRMGGTRYDYANSVAVDTSGHVLVAGYFYSSNFSIGGSVPHLATAGSYDAFVAKFDGASGNGLWSRSFGGTSSDVAYSVSTGAGDTVLLAGYFYSPTLTSSGGTKLTNAGSSDLFVAEIASTGDAVNWAHSLGGTGYESLRSAAVAPDGTITLAGSAGAGARLGSTPVGKTYLYSFDPTWLDSYQPESIVSKSLGFYGSQATGEYSLALGHNGVSDGKHAFTWGQGNFASGQSSTAWGNSNSASGYESTVWGNGNSASGYESTAWGYGNSVSGYESTAWGGYNNVDGWATTAWGYNNTVSGDLATVWGGMNTASSMAVTVMGMSNLGGAAMTYSQWSWCEIDPLLEVANGGWSGNANALTTLKNGQTTLTNKHWKKASDAGGDITDDIVATTAQVPDENGADIVDPSEYYSHGNALVVEGHTELKGNIKIDGAVILSKAQGDISMGIYGE